MNDRTGTSDDIPHRFDYIKDYIEDNIGEIEACYSEIYGNGFPVNDAPLLPPTFGYHLAFWCVGFIGWLLIDRERRALKNDLKKVTDFYRLEKRALEMVTLRGRGRKRAAPEAQHHRDRSPLYLFQRRPTGRRSRWTGKGATRR